ncbi:hypothetical protein RUND412_005332 [Rhizina undulata]
MLSTIYKWHVLERVLIGDDKFMSVLRSFQFLRDANKFARQRILNAEESADIDFLCNATDSDTGGKRFISYIPNLSIDEKEYRHVWVEQQQCPPRNSPGHDPSFPPLYAVLITTVFAISGPDIPQESCLQILPYIFANTTLLNSMAERTLRVRCGLDEVMTLEWLGRPFEEKMDENGFYWGRVWSWGALESITVEVIRWAIE